MAGIEENNKGHPARFLDQIPRAPPPLPHPRPLHPRRRNGRPRLARPRHAPARRLPHRPRRQPHPGPRHPAPPSADPPRAGRDQPHLQPPARIHAGPGQVHPFPEYLRTGIPVCLNTDDRGMWDSNLTDEYYTAVTTFNLSWDELVQLGRNSLAFSFAQPDVKAKLLADYEKAVAAFETKFAPPPTCPPRSSASSPSPTATRSAPGGWSSSKAAGPPRKCVT